MSSNLIYQWVTTKSVKSILLYGLLTRIILLVYCIYHDSAITHIKYTDVDYHVFTNGSKAILDRNSPYRDEEYRYSPLIALVFVPNVVIGCHFGKLILIAVDMICGQLVYMLNVHQGTYRQKSKLALLIWLLNPLTLAISTRGSFEPILTLLVLSSIYLTVKGNYVVSGFLFGLAVHLKIYPIIYCLALYGYMVQRKPYLITQSKMNYWLKTMKPNRSQIKFFLASATSFTISSYISYLYFGLDYVEQSFIYHMKRKDLQHNFSVYFYLFRLLPSYQDLLSQAALIVQIIGVIILSVTFLALDTNPKVKLRKLNFSLFCTTFVFVSLNKVCTSQYFSWYFVFVPLILDSSAIELRDAGIMMSTWLLAQANWLIFAYLYEYQKYDVIDYVGNSSLLFLVCNLWILVTLCRNFDAYKQKKQSD